MLHIPALLLPRRCTCCWVPMLKWHTAAAWQVVCGQGPWAILSLFSGFFVKNARVQSTFVVMPSFVRLKTTTTNTLHYYSIMPKTWNCVWYDHGVCICGYETGVQLWWRTLDSMLHLLGWKFWSNYSTASGAFVVEESLEVICETVEGNISKEVSQEWHPIRQVIDVNQKRVKVF